MTFVPAAQAATLCVDQHGKPGCYPTISAAVAAAAPGDTVNVDSGTYKEDVVIGESLSLVGQGATTTTIDAAGLANGIYIDGLDNVSLAEIVVTGFTVTNANFEGILVNDATGVTLWGNTVTGNDRSLQSANSACPGMPAFETSEGANCGSGIHLIGVTHSTVADNLVQQNAGGILLSDETNTTHDNVILRNLVQGNKYADGIALASHPPYTKPGSPVSSGDLANDIYNNNILDNDSIQNGLGGSGAGVGIYAAMPGERTYANSVSGNRLIGNALPGVIIHAGAPSTTSAKSPDVSRNAIVGNYIAANGPDAALPTSVSTGVSILGLSPVVDSVVSNNFIEDESIAVAFNSGSTLDIHLNDFAGRQVGIDNVVAGGGSVNARENWWGCSTGPGTGGCSTFTGGASVVVTPWLTRPMDGALGHGFDQIFDFIHSYDCDHNAGFFNPNQNF